MREVKTPSEVRKILKNEFRQRMQSEQIPLLESLGRVSADDITAEEYVPDFDRSTVDGYAVHAKDTFGCSEAVPALLKKTGLIEIGEEKARSIGQGECLYIPTGGKLPQGADAAVMIEYTEELDGMICVQKSAAPGLNLVRKGDDAFPGKTIIPKGRVMRGQDMGVLAALGITEFSAARKPVVGIISTGNELVDINEKPAGTRVRDINTYALHGAVSAAGAVPQTLGRFRDNLAEITDAVTSSLEKCDIVLVSGGSSVGTADLTEQALLHAGNGGEIFVHGIALKPGKPTIIGRVQGKAVYGLPGHPASAYFVFMLFVRPLIDSLLGKTDLLPLTVRAELAEDISSNHGREEGIPVRLVIRENGEKTPLAVPVGGKSGMISLLSDAQGYIMIERDREGLSKGSFADVLLF